MNGLNSCAVLFIFYLVCIFRCDVTYGLAGPYVSAEDTDQWPGKWFPQAPGKLLDDNPTIEYRGADLSKADLFDKKHGIKMGVPSPHCDDAKTNLTVDWDNSPINYTCFEEKATYLPNIDVHPTLHADHIPKNYDAIHKCMDTEIYYEDRIPTYGPHRPLWPKYGEYKFLPKQRWLHNLEHGAIVMLYHPCANKEEVKRLRLLVTGCLYRHIITPYTLLDHNRPLALLAWGSRFQMSKVQPQLVVQFIRGSALRGPEHKSTDGQFDFELRKPAAVVSDQDDHTLCPTH